jgi:hypothetical protein
MIRVFCDAPVDPVSARPTTCFLTLELPYPLDVLSLLPTGIPPGAGGTRGYQPLVLPAQVSTTSTAAANTIDLRFDGVVFSTVFNLLHAGFETQILARLTLKGKFIWGQQDPSRYLDGAAFGVARQDAAGTRIGLSLPTRENGAPGSDFDMWFWFARPILIKSLLLPPNGVTAGGPAGAASVTLDGFAPPGGATITLTANPNVVIFQPGTLVIPEGQTIGQFTVAAPANTTAASAQVTATYGQSTATGTLPITAVVRLTGIPLSPTTVLGGPNSNVTGTVTLNIPAPAGGANVSLSGDQPNAATVPASVLVPAGQQTSQAFTITTKAQPTNTAVTLTVTASYAGTSVKGTVTVLGPKLT